MRQMLSRIQLRSEIALCTEEGQGLTEYALILAFVAIVTIVALQLLGTNISSILNSIATAL